MHMADALLSPAVGGTMLAVSCGVLAFSVRESRRNFEESRIPLMGVAGAFVFAAQMVNFAIPGTGSSGHIGGAMLLAALLGPAPGFIVMAGVLLIQALFFADGGLLAWGCNLFNLGFFGCFLAYPYLFRPIAGKKTNRVRVLAASIVSCIVTMELGALAVTLETLVSGVTELPFSAFLTVMLSIHLAIGLGEGAATGAVLLFVRAHLPGADSLRLEEKQFSFFRLSCVIGLTALLIGGGLSLLASQKPDGLEWSIAQVAGEAEIGNSGAIHDFLAGMAEKIALFPDYALPGSESSWGTLASGIAGVLLCCVLLGAGGYVLCRRAAPRRSAK